MKSEKTTHADNHVRIGEKMGLLTLEIIRVKFYFFLETGGISLPTPVMNTRALIFHPTKAFEKFLPRLE